MWHIIHKTPKIYWTERRGKRPKEWNCADFMRSMRRSHRYSETSVVPGRRRVGAWELLSLCAFATHPALEFGSVVARKGFAILVIHSMSSGSFSTIPPLRCGLSDLAAARTSSIGAKESSTPATSCDAGSPPAPVSASTLCRVGASLMWIQYGVAATSININTTIATKVKCSLPSGHSSPSICWNASWAVREWICCTCCRAVHN